MSLCTISVHCLFLVNVATVRAGIGGGTVSMNPGTVDGKGFDSTGGLFAVGGTDCNRCCSFEDSHGGFGGGGGGCASGGGGGGRGGGSITSAANQQDPGEGGSSGPNAEALSNAGFNDGDGFVVFKHELCGCAHNCTVDNERSVFWCTCPTNTFVSPDGFDCYKGTVECGYVTACVRACVCACVRALVWCVCVCMCVSTCSECD